MDNTQQLFFAIIYLKKFVLAFVVALPSYMLKVVGTLTKIDKESCQLLDKENLFICTTAKVNLTSVQKYCYGFGKQKAGDKTYHGKLAYLY